MSFCVRVASTPCIITPPLGRPPPSLAIGKSRTFLPGRSPATWAPKNRRDAIDPRIELGMTLKTAKALGITFPPSIMVRADQVIQ